MTRAGLDVAAPIDDAAPQRCRGVLLPRFDNPADEADYRSWRIERAIPFSRVAMYASAMGWATLLSVSVWVGPGLSRPLLAAVALVMVPAMAAVLAATVWPSLYRHVLPVSALANFLGGLAAVYVSWQSGINLQGEPYADLGTAGVIVLAYFGCTIIRLPPGMAVATVVPYTILQQGMLLTAYAGDSARRLAFSAILWVSVASGIWLSVALERVWRETFRQERVIAAQQAVIEQERERAETLLRNILPAPVAEQLKAGPGVIARAYDDATVLFADLAGFTPLASSLAPDEVVRLLNSVFSRFDQLAAEHGVEKIKTIGDAYMAVGGVPEPRADHAEACGCLALAMCEAVHTLAAEHGQPLEFRLGMHCGPVVAGVIGTSKFAYDLWGDTVNTAARLESHGLAGAIQVSEQLATRLRSAGFRLAERGVVELKGKGPVRTWLLENGPGNALGPDAVGKA